MSDVTSLSHQQADVKLNPSQQYDVAGEKKRTPHIVIHHYVQDVERN